MSFRRPKQSGSEAAEPSRHPIGILRCSSFHAKQSALLTIRVLRSMRSNPVTNRPTLVQKHQQSTSAAPDPAASATHALIKRALVGAAGERAV